MRIKEQFDKKAKSYYKYSMVQQIGVELLIKKIPQKINTVIDLGCGDGRVYRQMLKSGVDFKKFYGIDFSKEMLKKHPKDANLILEDFNNSKLFDTLVHFNADILISASALQWAKDLNLTFYNCSKVAPKGAFFLFGSGTFKTLHKELNLNSPIYSLEDIKNYFLKSYKSLAIEEKEFILEFESSRDMLRYIKYSGVSGGMRNLKIKELKRVIKENCLKHLEFETIFLIGESKTTY